jgi:hypothetical protein
VRCQPHAQLPSWRTTLCRLSATAYTIYSQLPSIPGGRLLHQQHEDAPCRGDKGPTQRRFYCITGLICYLYISIAK